MNLQRLKFAFARGARVQCNSQQGRADWTSVENPSWFNWVNYRIHPDDAHLEYGPLSSALRHQAIEGDLSEVRIDWFAGIAELHLWEGVWAHFYLGDEVRWASSELAQMHFLFAAEMLADEGL